MPSIRIAKKRNSGFYYLTFTIRNWYYIFDRHNRFAILAESVKYCQKHKGLKLYAYVFMLNHIHLIASSDDMIGFVRDFKKFTSKEIQKNIIINMPKVFQLYHDLLPHALEQAWVIPTPFPHQYTFWWPWVKAYSGEQSVGYFMYESWATFIWIDQDLKKSMGY